MVYNFFDKKLSATCAWSETLAIQNKFPGGAVKSEIMSNQEWGNELHKPVARKFEKQKGHSLLVDKIWGSYVADMQLISKFNKGIRFLLCVVYIYNRYVWVVPWKNKKGITITNPFQNILDESNCKPNKIWVGKGSKFYNRSTKSWLEDNDREMYSACNKGKSVFAERFIRTLKNKIYKYDFSMKKVYIYKLNNIVVKYNNIYHSTFKIKPVDVKSNTYIDFQKKKRNNKKDAKFDIADQCKNIKI